MKIERPCGGDKSERVGMLLELNGSARMDLGEVKESQKLVFR